eukprot:865646-Pleurochrysis_carterae.AAC.1
MTFWGGAAGLVMHGKGSTRFWCADAVCRLLVVTQPLLAILRCQRCSFGLRRCVLRALSSRDGASLAASDLRSSMKETLLTTPPAFCMARSASKPATQALHVSSQRVGVCSECGKRSGLELL